MKRLAILTLGVCLISVNGLQAQDEFERVEVLDNPRFSLTNRFNVDAEFNYYPLNAFYKPLMLSLAGSYQFNDFWSWEVVRGELSIHNYDTGLNDTITADLRSRTGDNTLVSNSGGEFRDTKYKVSSSVFFNLLYSKSNFFNQAIVYHYWQIGSGIGFYDLGPEDQYSLDLTLRARFFINEHWLLNLRGGHSIGFNSDAPQSIVYLTVGGGFAI